MNIESPRPEAVLAGDERWCIVPDDVLAFLGKLPDQSVDLVFGSPPYAGKARRYGTGKNLKGQDWVDWMVEVFIASLRVTRGLVAFVVDGGTKDFAWDVTPSLLMADLHRRGITQRKPLCYVRSGIPGRNEDWFKNNWEFVICATHGGKLPWADNLACGHAPKYKRSGPFSNRKPDGTRNRRPYTPPKVANPGNVIACTVGGGQMGSKTAHANEAPFAEALPERAVRSFCPPDGITVDPFVGSGTTAKVALRWGRRFLGCDVRAEQVSLAITRIHSEVLSVGASPAVPALEPEASSVVGVDPPAQPLGLVAASQAILDMTGIDEGPELPDLELLEAASR